jgi:hypothetical protein
MAVFFEFTRLRYFKYGRHREKFQLKEDGKIKYGGVCEFTRWLYFRYGCIFKFQDGRNYKIAEYLNMAA